MAKKSIIDTRNYVPEYFGNNREFQVFLRLANLALSVIKSNTDNFIPNLLNPLLCKTRLLPLLSNYVGYDYDPTERVLTNRWITKLYPILVRNRGSETGLTLAIAIAICLLGDPDELDFDLEKTFDINMETIYDKWGRESERIKAYMYFPSYISILNKLIEVVRPAGLPVEFVPSQNITSSETIVLTDEHLITKYDYITGKLLSINDVDITIQNSWPVLVDTTINTIEKWKDIEFYIWDELKDYTWKQLLEKENPYAAIPGLYPHEVSNKNEAQAKMFNTRPIYLVDGRFYDTYGNDLNRYVDPESGKIYLGNGTDTHYIVRETRIYIYDNDLQQEIYTGMYFDVSQPAKVLNTYYKLLDDGIFSGFYVSNDDMFIYDSNHNYTGYRLINDTTIINGITNHVWRVFDNGGTIRYKWYVHPHTRRFEVDPLEGDSLPFSVDKMPFSNTTYIDKKAYIINIKTNELGETTMAPTHYFVNVYGDIVDNAGNIILTKQDRYKISDSTMIGFSEIHNNAKQLSTYDGTNILRREWSFMKDAHLDDVYGRDLINNYEQYERINDARYKFTRNNFNLIDVTREYTGTNLIRFISSDELLEMKLNEDNTSGEFIIPLFITEFDMENSSGILAIKADLPEAFSLGDVFNNINIRFENHIPNDEINPTWDIYIDWTANVKNKSLFNLNELENPIHFIDKGTITKRTLHWTTIPIKVTPKIYDGTTKVYTKGNLGNDNLNIYQTIYSEQNK